MTETWYAAFGLLGLLSVLNALLLVATMRQVGVLHQRIHPTGALEEEGPAVFRRMPRLALTPVAGSRDVDLYSRPVVLLAYVTAGCGACETLVPIADAYARDRPTDLVDVALATDSPAEQAALFLREHEPRVPFLRHDFFSSEYEVRASPYVLALTATSEESEHTIVLGGGVVNTLEQFEDVARQALENYDVQTGSRATTKVQWQEVTVPPDRHRPLAYDELQPQAISQEESRP